MHHLNQHDEARLYFTEVIESANNQSPAYVSALQNFASTAFKMHKYSEAYEYAHQAFQLEPWSSFVQGMWGQCLVEKGNVESGIHYLHKAYNSTKQIACKVLYLAYLSVGYHRLGKKALFEEYFDKLKQIDSSEDCVQWVKKEII